MGEHETRALRRLARLHHVQPSYRDLQGRVRSASPDALLLVLRALGAPLHRPADAGDALRERRRELWARALEPITVAWDGRAGRIPLRLRGSGGGGRIHCRLQLETGNAREWEEALERLPVHRTAEVDGERYTARCLRPPHALPPGYHRLTVEAPNPSARQALPAAAHTLLVSAPRRLHDPYAAPERRVWGAFLPAYAIRSGRNWGCGDLSDLEALGRWVGARGGEAVATLPLLACYLDHPFDPSPYAPVSRLFWNELYLDVGRIPDLQWCREARRLSGSDAIRNEIRALREQALVDYRRQASLKRTVLEALARSFFDSAPARRREAFQRFVDQKPDVQDYAAFRAAVERRGGNWRAWPARLRDGALRPEDYNEAARRYHLYVQWVAEEQMAEVARALRAGGVALYLDLPLGVHPDGYDVWRERECFAAGASAGAPPDPFFSRGQDWGFPPPHPERSREDGYGYLIRCLRHHLRHAGVLRIDHVMSLHRLFWVPHGAGAEQGVYVRYRPEEQYAILALESHRHGALIVGEDLGTVPAGVRAAMDRHGAYRMFVVPFEATANPHRPLPEPPPAAVAALNTHDMPTFRAFWEGRDIDDRIELGLLDEGGARHERHARAALRHALTRFLARDGLPDGDATAVALRVCLAWLARSPARIVLVNLEDLWGETRPQNVPGTGAERPNWRRKAGHSLEEIGWMNEIIRMLEEIDRLRREERC